MGTGLVDYGMFLRVVRTLIFAVFEGDVDVSLVPEPPLHPSRCPASFSSFLLDTRNQRRSVNKVVLRYCE